MRWLDVTGPPGVGKSTLCDEAWPPRGIPWDGEGYPEEWRDFLRCVDGQLRRIDRHPSIGACRSMITRSFRKMASVVRSTDSRVYVQTGFAQRGLGIGWRMVDLGLDVALVADYYRTMPVSLGVVMLTAPVDIVQRRNVERGKDRAFMVPLMAPAQEVAFDVLHQRGVPVLELDMTRPVDENTARLAAFERTVAGPGAAGSRGKGKVLQTSA